MRLQRVESSSDSESALASHTGRVAGSFLGVVVMLTACSAIGDGTEPSEKQPDPGAAVGGAAGESASDGGETGGSNVGGAGGNAMGGGGSGGDGSGGDGSGGDGTVGPELPKFVYRKMLVDRRTAEYNPSDEFSFPSVIETGHVVSPLGKYYLYYAPPDAPGGIALKYADNLLGPWTEYPQNPVISSHQASSPHAVWMEEYDKYFLYFQGEDTTIRWSVSSDGINWDVPEDNIAIDTAAWATAYGNEYTECFYARVFEYAIPGIGDPYTMTMTLRQAGHDQRIALATSTDGKHFTPRDDALITPIAVGETDIAGAFYFPIGSRHYILYNSASGNIHHTDVGAEFDQEKHLGALYTPGPSYPEYGKASAPFIWTEEGHHYLFYDAGTQPEQRIGLGVEAPILSVIVDQDDDAFSQSGDWAPSTAAKGYYGSNYLADSSAEANPGTWASWKPRLPVAGAYRVYVRYPAADNRPDHIKYKVYHQGQVDEIFVDQTKDNGSWVELGLYEFDAGSSDDNRVTLDAASDTGFTVADAVWFAFDE